MVERVVPRKLDLHRADPKKIPAGLREEMLEVLRDDNNRLERELAESRQRCASLDAELREERARAGKRKKRGF
jgi:hypothetical protein